MRHLTRRDGKAFTISPPNTKRDCILVVQEAVALADATGLYVAVDFMSQCRIVVDSKTNPTRTASEWWNGPRSTSWANLGTPYATAYQANDRIRENLLHTAPPMAINDRESWERTKSANRNYTSLYNLAERWARLMQRRMKSSSRLTETTVHLALYEADADGIVQAARDASGRNAVLDALGTRWEHGAQLKKLF